MTQSPPIESVDRAVRVLQELAAAGPGGISLVNLASNLDLNKATAHRMLAALKFRDFAAQDMGTGHYILGGAAAQLGSTFYAKENLAALLHPVLLALSAQVSELVHLGTINGTNIIYLDKVEPDRAVRVFSAIGSSVPVISTAMGRALLSARGVTRDELATYMSAAPQGSRAAELSADDVWHQIEFARAKGFAKEDQENEAGISCIAVPLFRGGQPVAAVSITAPSDRMTATRMKQLFQTVTVELGDRLPDAFSLA